MKTKENKQISVKKIISILEKTYPNAKCSLNYENAYQLLIATILSAQCTDERVNLVTPELFKKYPDFKTLSNANTLDLEKLIKSTGFYKNKAKSLLECSKSIIQNFNGKIPRDIESFTQLRGVGRKTANVVLGNAFHIASGIVVDTHVTRLSSRLGLTKNKDAVKIEFDLQKIIPQKNWILFSHYLVFHGRARCMARKPDCGGCELKNLCPKIGVQYEEKPKSITPSALLKIDVQKKKGGRGYVQR